MNWQPIETAPMDGTDILIFHDGICSVGWYMPHKSKWQRDTIMLNDPTHWMPLPEPPK